MRDIPLPASTGPDRPAGTSGMMRIPDEDPVLRIQALEAELRELQHRAKNSLQMVISLFRLQAGRIRDPDARAAYDQTMLRIEALAILYRHLHESGSGTHVDLGRYLTGLSETVRAEVQKQTSGVTVTVDCPPTWVGLYEAMPLGLIFVELLSNSLHHAFPDKGWIRTSVRPQGVGRARMTIEDNGRGLPAGFDDIAEDGLMLAEALAGQLGDTLATTQDAGGNRATVSFPI